VAEDRCHETAPKLRISAANRLQGNHCLDGLAPQGRCIAVEAFESAVVEVGEPQEAVGQNTSWFDCIVGERIDYRSGVGLISHRIRGVVALARLICTVARLSRPAGEITARSVR